jgi:hypothetical protein
MVITAVAFVAGTVAFHSQTAAAAAQTAPTAQERSASAAGTAPESDGLSDLAAMTFSCPRAGLNAAAREAAKVRSQGTYQFAYFRIIDDAHHAAYEVHFESNYVGEPDLKYCVSMYCQQGWDPEKTEISVSLMSNEPQRAGAAAHGADCGDEPAPAQRE